MCVSVCMKETEITNCLVNYLTTYNKNCPISNRQHQNLYYPHLITSENQNLKKTDNNTLVKQTYMIESFYNTYFPSILSVPLSYSKA